MRIITDKELRVEALKYVTVNHPPSAMVEGADEIYQWLKTGKIEMEEPDDIGD